MSEVFYALFLSLIQGITEFIPVSSSGHLVLFENILDLAKEGTKAHLLNIILHLGTMCATVIIFRKDIYAMSSTLFSYSSLVKLKSMTETKKDSNLWLIVLIVAGTIPTAVVGLIFRDYFKAIAYGSLLLVGVFFLVTGIFLFMTRFYSNKDSRDYISIKDAIIIGLMQGLSIAPGISRSGITISVGLIRGISQDKMISYSFLLSLPAILGATIFEMFKVDWSDIYLLPFIIGFIGSFISGYFALLFLINFIKKGRFKDFSYYCFFIGFLCIILSLL